MPHPVEEVVAGVRVTDCDDEERVVVRGFSCPGLVDLHLPQGPLQPGRVVVNIQELHQNLAAAWGRPQFIYMSFISSDARGKTRYKSIIVQS